MMWNEHDISGQVQTHRKDLRNQADKSRLIHEARSHSMSKPQLIGAFLVALGNRLVSWGGRLQSHYDKTAKSTASTESTVLSKVKCQMQETL